MALHDSCEREILARSVDSRLRIVGGESAGMPSPARASLSFEDLAQSLGDPLLILDEEGHVFHANAALTRTEVRRARSRRELKLAGTTSTREAVSHDMASIHAAEVG